jgi:hypothetical protein
VSELDLPYSSSVNLLVVMTRSCLVVDRGGEIDKGKTWMTKIRLFVCVAFVCNRDWVLIPKSDKKAANLHCPIEQRKRAWNAVFTRVW